MYSLKKLKKANPEKIANEAELESSTFFWEKKQKRRLFHNGHTRNKN